jgi:protein-S-isoprenylcysteine O-methyltransferase Ste14
VVLVRDLYLITWVGWGALELRQSLNRRPGAASADRGSRLFLQGCCLVGVVVASVLRAKVPAGDIHPAAAAAWAGLPVLWLGVALRLWSFRTLGRYFTFTVQTSADQPVIADGPYRLLRHPSYAGILCVLVGAGLSFDNWWSLFAIATLSLVGIVRRIRVEEHALIRAIGVPYVAYAATHKRLVPFIW